MSPEKSKKKYICEEIVGSAACDMQYAKEREKMTDSVSLFF